MKHNIPREYVEDTIPEDDTETTDRDDKYDELPERVCTLLENSETNNLTRSNGQGGVPDIDIVYELYINNNRLGMACTVSGFVEEFDIIESSARTRLQNLAEKGLVQEHQRNGHLYTVDPALCDDIAAADVPKPFECDTTITTDGSGMPRTGSPTETTGPDNQPPHSDSAFDSTLSLGQVGDDLTVPIASVVGFFITNLVAINFLGASSASPSAAVLIIGLTWMLSKVAALPDHLPQETARRMDLGLHSLAR